LLVIENHLFIRLAMQANLCNKGGEVIEQHGRHLQGGEVAAVLEVHRVLQVGELVPQLPVGRRRQIKPEAGTAHGHRGLHPIQLQTPVGLGHVLQIETSLAIRASGAEVEPSWASGLSPGSAWHE